MSDPEQRTLPPSERRHPLTENARPAPSPSERRSTLTNTRTTRIPAGTDPILPRPRLPRLAVDPAAVSARYRAVLSAPHGREFRSALVQSVSDVPALLSEVERLWLSLVATRRQHANLLAAARAALAADRDGEADPLAYLRDELPDASLSGEHRGRW